MNTAKYDARIRELSAHVGERNAILVTIALSGLGCGVEPEQIANDIANNCGAPRLSDAEIRRAVDRALELHRNPATLGSWRSESNKVAEAPTEEQTRFVEDVLGDSCGSDFSAVQALSPVHTRGMDEREQALTYCATVFPDDRHMVFTCDEDSIRRKRTFDRLMFPSILFRRIQDGMQIPNYAIANQFTGKESKGGSCACMEVLATRRLTLIEFDSMPLEKQCALWVNAIKKNAFPGLRTIVYSGSKSLHALVRIGSAEPYLSDEVDEMGFNVVKYRHDGVDDVNPAAIWKRQRATIQQNIENSADTSLRCDRACKDPTRLTRFAGASRIKDGERRVQRLLYCTGPRVMDDVRCVRDFGNYPIDGYGKGGIYA